ncbi:unnamed protein product, partial [Ectocarpus sp. 6 AP-2014]
MDTHRSKKRKRTNMAAGTSRACPQPATLRAKKDGSQRSCVACGVSVRGGIAGWAAGSARCVECGEEYHLGCVDPSVPYVRRAGWVCGVCSSNDHHRSRGERSAAAEAAAQLSASQQQRQQQQQQEGVDAPPSRVVHVLSSALTRLSSLPDGGGGSGGGGKVTAGPRAPNGMNPTAAAAAAATAAATATAATTATATAVAAAAAATATTRGGESSSGRWNRKRGDTVTTTDSVLAWALRSIGGNGDEGTKRNLGGVGDASSCGSSGAGVVVVGGGSSDSFPGVIYEEAKGGGGGPNSRLLPREREGVNRSGRGGSNGDGSDVAGSGDGAIGARDDGSSRKRSLGAREDREEESEKPGFWDMDENTRFLQGVTKHGGAWARLAQKHGKKAKVKMVVAVEESEGEDSAHASRRNNDDNGHVDEGRDSDGVGGDKPRTSLAAGPAGEGTKQPGKKARKGGDKGSKQGKVKKKQKSRRGSSEWDDEEHERFVKGFERHGKAWAEVAQVVRTRDEGQVQGYSARWVTRTGGLHESFRKIGEWEGDEHDRFMEARGVKLYGRSWVDVASVVRTRTNRQVIMHAMHRLNDDLSSKPSLRACTSTGPQATDRAPLPAQPRAAVNGGDWGDDEHEAFVKARRAGVKIYGRSWVSVARLMGTRTNEQVRAHAKQYLNKDLTEKRPWRSKRSKSTTPPVPKSPTPCRKVAAAASPASAVGVASAPAAFAPSSVPARPARRKAAAAAAARIESTTAGGDADGGGDGEWCRDAADAGHDSSSVAADGSESASESKTREETWPPPLEVKQEEEEEEEGGGWSKRARLPGEVGGGAHEEGHTQDKSAGKKKKAKKKKKKKKEQ